MLLQIREKLEGCKLKKLVALRVWLACLVAFWGYRAELFPVSDSRLSMVMVLGHLSDSQKYLGV
jgi:hypothetical protein